MATVRLDSLTYSHVKFMLCHRRSKHSVIQLPTHPSDHSPSHPEGIDIALYSVTMFTTAGLLPGLETNVNYVIEGTLLRKRPLPLLLLPHYTFKTPMKLKLCKS